MLAKLLYGYKATQCLYVVAKLNIADHLSTGNKSIAQLAKITHTKPDPLYRVMRCLASLGVFHEDDDGYFSLNKEAEDLCSDSENTWKEFIILCGEELYQAAGQLLYTVEAGLPAFNHMYGMSHWEYLEAHPNKATIFHDAMEKGTESMLKEIIKHYNFSNYKNIIDVGGGKGQLLSQILIQHPQAKGTVFDLENAKIPAIEFINKNSLAARCNFLAGNFFISIPSGGDIYLLKVVLHDWDDESTKAILQNCKKSMSKSSKLLIIEKVIEENKFKDLACLGDINMLVMYTGKERTLSEFQNLLTASGLRFVRKINTETVFSIIEAEVE
jgi:hypothetical protein